MNIVFAEAQRAHYPRFFLVNGIREANPEVPDRAGTLLGMATEAGHTVTAPEDHGTAPIAAVHTPEYLQFLEHAYRRWRRIGNASDEVLPNVHPDRRDGSYPASVVAQAGFHMADTACPIGEATWESVRWSANTAVEAAKRLVAGEGAVYALCRPPGHHAFADMAGGFCYVNNAAVAAQVLLERWSRVAVLDIDLHHGNGTQGIFYGRDDVLTVSLHADPVRFYPFYWGHADERGEGRGLGYNLNLPIPRGTGDADYVPVLEKALLRIRSFSPGALVLALGLDAHEGDPLAGLSITTEGFRRIGQVIGSLELPSVLVQEGGYLSEDLGRNLVAVLDGFMASRD